MKRNLGLLRTDEILRKNYENKVAEHLAELSEEATANERYNHLKRITKLAADEILPMAPRKSNDLITNKGNLQETYIV